MIKQVFICSYEDLVRDTVKSAGNTEFDVGEGAQWANATTISGLFGSHSRTIDNVSGDTITLTAGFSEDIPIMTDIKSGEKMCTYNHLMDTSGPDGLFSESCRQKNCQGYVPPYEAHSSTPIFKIEKTATPYTVKSLGCDFYRYGFYGDAPDLKADGITPWGGNTWLADTSTGLVSPLIGFWVDSGMPVGLPNIEKFALVWKGKFYARHTGTVTFQFIGNGHYDFDFDGSWRRGGDVKYDTYYTWTSSSLNAGSFYDFRVEFYTTARAKVGFTAMWKSNAAGAFPDYLPMSAGVMIRTSDSEFLSSYELPSIINAEPDYRRGEISELRFRVPLVKNNNTEGEGYYKDTDTEDYEHASWDTASETFKHQAADANYTLGKYDMVEYSEGYQSNSETDDYVQKFTGHIIDFEPSREPGNSSLTVVCRDFGQLLKDSFSENNPNRLDYWMAGYGDQSNSETTPEGLKVPTAWDGWELRKMFMISHIDAGIDPSLFDEKRQAFDKDWAVGDGSDWEITDPELAIFLDKKINYGNPDAIGDFEGHSEDTAVDDEYLFKYDYGTNWLDIVDDVTSQYLFDNGFTAEGYPWLRGRLIPTDVVVLDDISVSGGGW